jgi:hypothetical protein
MMPQKVTSKKTILTKIAESGVGSGFVSQRYGSADPDPYQYVTDPHHCYGDTGAFLTLTTYSTVSAIQGMAQLVACQAAVRQPRVRISARHPNGGPLPELAAMKKLERNSANVMNECV